MAMATRPACAASELVAKGRHSAAVLQAMLGQLPAVGAGATAPHGLQDLAEQILRCCDRALAALHSSGTGTEKTASSSSKRKPELEGGLAAAPPPAATRSKRNRMSRGEKGARVEKKGTMEDGFMWRKYGQKDINGSNYPRLYFRCTYKDDRGCMARRQVQQSDTNPSVYLITYFDEHTCCLVDAVEPQPPAPFVINFGSSAAASDDQEVRHGQSCDTSALSSSLKEDEDELHAGTCSVVDFVIKRPSTPVPPEMMGMITLPEWDPMDGLDWDLGNGESSFDIDDLVRYDFDYIDLL